MPQKPRHENFPAIRILFNLKSEDQEPARMPVWQRLLWLGAPALLILGMAQPRLNPDKPLESEGPVLLVVDNGWASARNWQARAQEIGGLIDRAEREERPVIVLPTAPPEDGGAIRPSGPMSAADARRMAADLEPLPWAADRQGALNALGSLEPDKVGPVFWLSNGLDDGAALPLAARLKDLGPLTVMQDAPADAPRLLVPPDTAADKLAVTVRRSESAEADTLILTASNESGRAIDRVEVSLKEGQAEARAVFDLPPEVRGQLARVSIDGENSAGATILLDEQWRRRPVGLVDAGTTESVQALLSESGYIGQALDPYVNLRQGSVDDLLKDKLAVLILPDAAALGPAAQAKLDKWVAEGGTLLRFAGPRLAAQTQAEVKDNLLPVQLRPGSRVMGGQLSGSKQGRLAPFERNSPFHGIRLPGNVAIDQGVLAQPGLDLEEKTWARLEDGTPLVTASQKGEGWVVLVHTTANADWSNLVLSGVFVDMMRAIVNHSQGVANGPEGAAKALPALKTLDGRGRMADPGKGVRALTREAVEKGTVGPEHPPGFYGDDSARHAHNLAAGVTELKPLPALPEGVARETYDLNSETDLSGPLKYSAMLLMMIAGFVLLGQRGMLPRPGTGPARAPAGPKGP